MIALKRVAVSVYVLALVWAAGLGIALAAAERLLIPFALPAAAALVLAARVLGPRAELAAWAVFTAWLGSTYLFVDDTTAVLEVLAFLVCAGLAVLGALRSPHLLAVAWLLHPVWDFLPRELPELLLDLPVACILFDVPIGLYLLWGARTDRWEPVALRPHRDTAGPARPAAR